MEEIDLETGSPGGEGAVSVHWFDGFYNDGSWHHEIGISGGATAATPGGIQGQKYGVRSDDGSLSATVDNDKFGQYPAEDDSTMPGWMQPLLDEAIGTLSTGAGWFLAVDESLNEAMGNDEDGMDGTYYDNGFRYRNTNRYRDSWGECCYSHRVDWQSEDPYATIETYGAFGESQTPWGTSFKEVEIDLKIWGDKKPIPSVQASALEQPETLTERERNELGIKRVPADADLTRTVDGETVTPEFIATEPLLGVENVEQRTTYEDHDGNELSPEEV